MSSNRGLVQVAQNLFSPPASPSLPGFCIYSPEGTTVLRGLGERLDSHFVESREGQWRGAMWCRCQFIR